MWLAVSGFMVMGLVSGLSLASHLACARVWSDSGSFLVAVHPSAKMDPSVRAAGRLTGRIISSLLLLAPPKFCQLVFSGSTAFFIRISCCETARASGYGLSLCLAKAGGFSQQFPNRNACPGGNRTLHLQTYFR